MDALTAFLTGGLSAVAVYALAQGKPPPTPVEVWQTLKETKPLLTKTFTFDITQARNNQEFIIVGSRVFISNPESPSVPVYIRFNEQQTEPLDLTRHRSIQVPFYRFFITNAVGTGTLTIIVNKFEAVALSESTTNIRVTASGIMLPVDIQAQFITLDVNTRNWGGTALTGRDISLDLARLDVALSTRATEATVASILAKLDVALSTRATEATLASLLARLDVALSTRASEATLGSVLAKLDVNLSSLDVDISTVEAALAAIFGSLGTKATEATLTSILAQLNISLSALRDALRGAATKDFSTLETDIEARQCSAVANGGVDVADASTLILALNANRKYVAIVNDSDATIYLGVGAAAVMNQGIRLNANGGSYEINWTNLYTGAIYGIHGSVGANKRVTTVEGT